MKIAASFALLLAMLASGLPAQTDDCCFKRSMPHRVRLSPELAEKLLVHKANLVCPHAVMPARVTGTVVLAILIGKSGDVLYPKVISGPAMLQKPVLDAVRKYKYKPYLINDKAVQVQTTVSVSMDSYRDCGAE